MNKRVNRWLLMRQARSWGMRDHRPHSNLHDEQVNDPLEPLLNESRIGINVEKRRFTRSTDACHGEEGNEGMRINGDSCPLFICSRISAYLMYLLNEKIVDTGICYASEIKHHQTAFKNCFKFYGKNCSFDWKWSLNPRISIKIWRFPSIFVFVISLDLPLLN